MTQRQGENAAKQQSTPLFILMKWLYNFVHLIKAKETKVILHPWLYMNQKEIALNKVSELVHRFNEQYDSYKKTDYNETQTRRDFIDPFFKVLGWDIDNEEGYAEAYREVIHEDKVKVGGATKAPDYSFRLVGGKRLFFVEAKKPSVAIKEEIQPAFQVRRYGWSAKLPISIVTNFEEFSIYDCTKKPNLTDKASIARIKYLTFHEYLNEFDFIWEIFSKEQVLKGSFDKFVQSDTQKKGTTTVDKDFLQSLDGWRTCLATSISWNNKDLDEDEINFVVQQTIDRIIFLRIAEDRSVEPYGNLKHALLEGDYYQNLFQQFCKADEKYNSGIFDFKKDRISEHLKIENKIIKTILNELYYPSPYAFDAMPVEILGTAYEQFLGKVIRITPAHHAKIEEKPEVRKAGGVYYTPQYIVEYIVKNTVGKLIDKKTLKEISKIKIVDPACGSGSFLIGAYQYLMDFHKNYYSNNGKPLKSKGGKEDVLTPDGHLTTSEKKRILLNNIFGVDIDVNAVEVTKLSLLLKCMEGETEASIATQLRLFNERVLPTLDNNIKDGNSLVDTDFYADTLDFGEEKKVKPFNWQSGFQEVFKEGGFDVVIGNPPYLKLTANNSDSDLLSYYQKKFLSYSGGSSKNLFQLFLERVTSLSPRIFSFIVPEALLTTDSNGKIREILLQNFNLNSIVTFDHYVFEDATIGTTIIVGEKNTNEKTKIVKIDTAKQQSLVREIKLSKGIEPWEVSFDDISKKLFKKILSSSKLMGELVEMSKGMVVKNRNDVLTQTPTRKSLPFLLGNCMKRYHYHYEKYAEYEKLDIIGGTRNLSKHTSHPRLLIRRTGSSLCATYSDKQELIESTIYILRSDKVKLKFLLGLINSKLLSFYLSKRLVTNSQGFPQVLMGQLEQLPIVTKIKTNQNEIVKLVNQLLQLNQEKEDAKLQTKINQLQSKINYCENRINEIVYKLYGLTEDEIKIVQGK
jgi:type I restriction-modification system DNA methylase subunit